MLVQISEYEKCDTVKSYLNERMCFMTHRNRKRYPEEFKKQIVDFYNVGTPVAKLASEYGCMA